MKRPFKLLFDDEADDFSGEAVPLITLPEDQPVEAVITHYRMRSTGHTYGVKFENERWWIKCEDCKPFVWDGEPCIHKWVTTTREAIDRLLLLNSMEKIE